MYLGRNGAGKSTILKSITRQLPLLGGSVSLDGRDMAAWSPRELAQQVAVVLTDRVRPELMTCAEVVAMGRYPYTNMFGRLTPEDKAKVRGALERVRAWDLAEQDFLTLSDGQRQRVLLARAICQEPQLMVLDEPTAYLDIRHKVELLDILREMAREQGLTVIMSLHEIDLAAKVSDELLFVKGDTVTSCGRPEDVLRPGAVEQLYDMEQGSYNLLFGSVELTRPQGEPQVFVLAGNGRGTPWYRHLQKRKIPFATGILYENDTDAQVAQALSSRTVIAPAFMPIGQEQFDKAVALLLSCRGVIDSGTRNDTNERLLAAAKEHNIPIYKEVLP